MPDIAAIIQSGASNPWLYLPLAVVLGALHALEPGHSKTMMAGFIVAVRGTPGQATLLGVSAAVGHTIVVWGLALLGLYLGDRMILDRAEPWLVLVSGLMIMSLAFRIFWMLRRKHDHHHDHPHDHPHDHDHAGHSHDGGAHDHHHHGHEHGGAQDHHRHEHGARHGHHTHGHVHLHLEASEGDAHAAAHAREIKERFVGRTVTNLDILWFGFTGGLLPCPAAIAVLLICLQLKAFTLGIGMVAAFSVGLAITLVSVGLVAAWGHRAVSARWGHAFDHWAERLPYVSATLVFAIGSLIAARGFWMIGGPT